MALAEFDSDAMDALKALSIDTGELVPKYHLDMGYPPLNKMLTGSPFRGLTCGRIYEIAGPASSGKTLLATMAMIAAQEQGGIAIMEDWEQAFSADLAAQIGLCVEAPYFIYNRPETWEDGNSHAMKVAKMVRDKKMIPDDAPIVVVFDSIAAATAMSQLYDSKGVRREIDSMGMNDTTALARATSLTLKIINNQIGHYNVVAIYLNQIRTKPGVCYGDPTCLRGDVMIPFVDGTSAPIEIVVRNKIDKEVWSYNEPAGTIEPKKIIGWHDNGIKGTDKQWIHIRCAGVGTRNGVTAITVTNDHKVYVDNRGWINAADVQVGDKMLSRSLKLLTGKTLSAHEDTAALVEVVEVHQANDRVKHRMYDITVDGNHNFLCGDAANGVLVHNCTPGGGAMEYYASTRIFTGMKRTFDGTGSDKELTGTLIGMTTKKNKIAKPLQTTHLRLMYGDDALARFDWTGGYIDELVDSGQLAEKSGRVEWEGKTYFRSQLIKKIDEEGRLQDLKNMYLEPYKR